MKIGLIGKKIGMTRIFKEEDRSVVPVVIIKAGPCYITDIKKSDNSGYTAVQLGFDDVPEKKLNKPLIGYFKKLGLPPMRILKEIRLKKDEDIVSFNVGEKLTVDIFKEGEYVDVTGTSIGKGFQGVVKRHKFHGGPDTHGSMSHRAPGSIGGTTPPRVLKGKRMAGHLGNSRVTVQNLQIIKVLPEENILFVKGQVPGPSNSYILVRKALKK
ncbi:MAG: 50S ribosomal protein L3 [Candidatus Ratteibacteria bacterium]|nr:50S ribosomal protein L3 [Candidatus Ratteibacteria bacterium]